MVVQAGTNETIGMLQSCARPDRKGHMALQFANKWGCEVHAFTASDSKVAEARKLGAHYVHNTKHDGVLKKLAGSLNLIISTINVPPITGTFPMSKVGKTDNLPILPKVE
jgi:hypothetical protein